MIHVIVADDQALIRGALSVLIDLEDDMRVVAQAADGREAIAAVEAYNEVEVLRAFESGGTVEDVASELMLSAGTVRNYVSSAMEKTHARTRAEALKVATENGWL